MKFKVLSLVIIFFAAALTGLAQTAEQPTVTQILDKFVKAIGGKEANEKIKSRVTTGKMTLAPMGISGTFESQATASNKSYIKSTIVGVGDILQGYDGEKSWMISPIQGNIERTGESLIQAKLSSQFHRFTRLKESYPKMELKGVEKVGDKDAYVIVATPEGTKPETFYFDKESGLLVRSDMTSVSPEGEQQMQSYYEDYREVDGVKLAFKSRTVTPQFEIITTIDSVKHDAEVKDSVFAKPGE